MSETATGIATEPRVIAEIFARTRQITRFFLSKIPEDRIAYRPVAEGKKLNSALWIIGHLVWAENAIALRATGGEASDIPWLDKFSFGSSPSDDPSDYPDFSEIMRALDEQEKTVLEHIRNMDPAALDKQTGGSWLKTYRDQLYHLIRHEGSHSGHLGWLAAIYGADTP